LCFFFLVFTTTACGPDNLLNDYIGYHGYLLSATNLPGLPAMGYTVDTCLTLCITASPSCPAFNFNAGYNRCGAVYESRFQVTSSAWTANTAITHYQRKCA
jgi:hypothetical protein